MRSGNVLGVLRAIIKKFYMGNGQSVDVLETCIGNVELGGGRTLHITDVLFSHNIIQNLISIRKLVEYKHEMLFKSIEVLVLNGNGTVLCGYINGNIYVIG